MIGHAIDRVDAGLKVTGAATYAAEWTNSHQVAHGYLVPATIGKGRILAIETRRAERAPGVLLVMTHLNAPRLGRRDPSVPNRFQRARPVLAGPEIRHYGQTVALVVASTFEQARAAAAMMEIRYEQELGHFDLRDNLARAYAPAHINVGMATDTESGDFEKAFEAAAVRIDREYTTPYHFANALEPHACVALWKGEELTLYTGMQTLQNTRVAMANTLGIDPGRIHVVAPFVGGGFGSKLGPQDETVLAALAARALRHPVKVVLTRQQMFQIVGQRPATIQRIRLAAEPDGRLIGVSHEVWMQTRADDEFGEQTATVSRALYAAPHRMTRHRLVPLDLRDAQPVRGPGELPGLLAAESAMDELAYVLGIDPLALRIRNEPDRDPERGVPFAGRRLVECMVEGARRFGWANRPLTPASRREGRLLVGYGMAAEMRMHFQQLSKARVHLSPDCKITVRTDMTDIGTGTYTILAQVAAQELGTDAADVQVLLGDSDYPVSAGSGGSWGAANSSVAVARACRTLRQRLAESGGHIGPGGIEAEGETAAMTQEHNYQEYSHHTYGANFAEVTVDIDTGEVRVRRMLGVFCAGRIVNPKTARSQIIGGMIWGIGSALFEEATVDPRYGHFVNRDLAEYNIAAHADIPAVDAVLLDDFDERANEMGIKGVGELGVCGSGAAIANAVFNATGVRVREFPITLDKILAGSPPAI